MAWRCLKTLNLLSRHLTFVPTLEKVVYKTTGSLQICHQSHSPSDVMAWHDNYVPYSYAV